MKTTIYKLLNELRERMSNNYKSLTQNNEYIKRIVSEPRSEQREKKIQKRLEFNKKVQRDNTLSIELQNNLLSFIRTQLNIEDFSIELENINQIQNKITDSKSKYENMIKSLNHNQDIEEVKPSKSYKKEEVDSKNYENMKSLFELTISGEIEFNKNHPKYHNEKFVSKLIKHYSAIEEYEKCAELSKLCA